MLFYKYVKNYVTIMEVNNFFPLSYAYCGVMGPKSYNGAWGLAESVVVRVRGRISPRTS